jgi:cellulose synthase operon protein B
MLPDSGIAQTRMTGAGIVTGAIGTRPASVAGETSAAQRARSNALTAAMTLADLGFRDGFRFANLGGHREIFVPLPQGIAIAQGELVLIVDDMTAHDARRSLEVLVNERSASAIALDGHGAGRVIRIPLANAKTQDIRKDGFLKISFQYAGAATADRCIDVRSVGDSLTIRPESAIEVDLDPAGISDIATAAALMPRTVALVLPARKLSPRDIAAALTVARALAASGRRVTFHYGYESLPELAKRSDPRRWSRGLVVIGGIGDVSAYLDSPVAVASLAGPLPSFGMLALARIGGLPSLLVSDVTPAQASRLIGSPALAATRGLAAAAVGDSASPRLPSDRISFAELGLAPEPAEVFGRADIAVAIDTRMLPAGTKPARLALDLMVAPDGDGEHAVASVFVNERLLGSLVAQTDAPTRFDLPLPDGLVGILANVRASVQRRSAQGDCRFEPQGYPAQILGTSSLVLGAAAGRAHDFSDLVPSFAGGLEVLLPASAADEPARVLGAVSGVLNALTPETAAITVKLAGPGAAPTPEGPFIAVGESPPAGVLPRARFDRGRVMVVDRADRTVLDLAGFAAGAVAQIVMAGEHPGLWVKPLAADGALPAPADMHLDRGDVAFIDQTGVAMTMSSERDSLVRIVYPDQVSWLTVAERFRSWIVGALWLLGTLVFLLVLQRTLRRRPASAGDASAGDASAGDASAGE